MSGNLHQTESRTAAMAGLPHLTQLRVPLAERDFIVCDQSMLPFAAMDGSVDVLSGAHCYGLEPDGDPNNWPEIDFPKR